MRKNITRKNKRTATIAPAPQTETPKHRFEVVDTNDMLGSVVYWDDLAEAVKQAHPRSIKVDWTEVAGEGGSFRSRAIYALTKRLNMGVKIAIRGEKAFIFMAGIPDWVTEGYKKNGK